MKAIILAAGRGSRMGELTDEQPKCLLEVYGKPLIEHQIEALRKANIKEIALVTGYKSELLNHYGTHKFHNAHWFETNMVYSLLCAKEWLTTDDCIVSYADIYYGTEIIKDLVDCSDEMAIAYDPNWLDLWAKRFENPLDDAETFRIDADGYLLDIGQKPKTISEIQGQYMGLVKLRKSSSSNLFKFPNFFNTFLTDYLSFSIANNFKIKAIENKSFWHEIDTLSDLEKASYIFNSYRKDH